MPSDLVYQPKFSNAVQRLLVRKARTGKFTARKLHDECATFLTVRKVQHLLQNTPDLRWARSIGIQPLSRNHQRRHQNWCRNHLKQGAPFWCWVKFQIKNCKQVNYLKDYLKRRKNSKTN